MVVMEEAWSTKIGAGQGRGLLESRRGQSRQGIPRVSPRPSLLSADLMAVTKRTQIS